MVGDLDPTETLSQIAIAAVLAEQAHVPVVVVADLSKGEIWPYRVASYAPASVRFVPPDRGFPEYANAMRRDTIVIGTSRDLPMGRLEFIARFGERTVARVSTDAAPGAVRR